MRPDARRSEDRRLTPSGPFHRTGLRGVWTKSQVARGTRSRIERRQGHRAEARCQGLQGDRLRRPSRFHPTVSWTARSSTAQRWRPPCAASSRAATSRPRKSRRRSPGNAVIVKKIPLPVMTEAELAESIYWEAEQYIPSTSRTSISTTRSSTGRDTGKGTMDVLLVAAKNEKISDYTGVIGQAGRSAVVIDVDAFALQNAYEANYGADARRGGGPAQCRRQRHQHQHPSGEQSVFTRDISIGGNAYTEALQRELSLPFEQADQLKRGQTVNGTTYEDARPVLRAVTENVMLEIQKTFDFFKATAASDRINRIVISGGASRAEAFARDARRPFRGAGRTVRSVQEDLRSTRPGSRPTSRRWPRRPPLLSASRFDGQVTDDSHQPPDSRAHADACQEADRHDAGGAAGDRRRLHRAARDGSRYRLVVLVAPDAVADARSRNCESRDRHQEPPLGAGAGPEVRDPQRRSSSSA